MLKKYNTRKIIAKTFGKSKKITYLCTRKNKPIKIKHYEYH